MQQGGVGAKSKQLIKEANTAYEAGDFDAVVKTQEAVAHQVARSMWNKVPKELQVGTYDDFIQSLLWDKKDSVKKARKRVFLQTKERMYLVTLINFLETVLIVKLKISQNKNLKRLYPKELTQE